MENVLFWGIVIALFLTLTKKSKVKFKKNNKGT